MPCSVFSASGYGRQLPRPCQTHMPRK
ncbi:hypothetical protein BC936DRAFT_146463 [Jimgerdemannia flammicorona]|uniref:Uncharacterized protein n=1 Tax=Jimgerdemannia flammicorona TaxID=994334 RepID=A0A433D7K3_9FUNG|nr:hypothetical protein BC936DRAFT_146463 [Jimgerdemannia flammicorona]